MNKELNKPSSERLSDSNYCYLHNVRVYSLFSKIADILIFKHISQIVI